MKYYVSIRTVVPAYAEVDVDAATQSEAERVVNDSLEAWGWNSPLVVDALFEEDYSSADPPPKNGEKSDGLSAAACEKPRIMNMLNYQAGDRVRIAPKWDGDDTVYVIVEWNIDRGVITPLYWPHGVLRPAGAGHRRHDRTRHFSASQDTQVA